MQFTILEEHGLEHAVKGMSLSYNTSIEKAYKRAELLAPMDGGHNKFIESIAVWLDITATRGWWQQMATYRTGITTQSESTMHTILRRPLERKDFHPSTDDRIIAILNAYIASGNLKEVSMNLPEGFLQRRIIMTNYKTLRNIWQQRHDHKREEWIEFCEGLQSLKHYNFIVEKK